MPMIDTVARWPVAAMAGGGGLKLKQPTRNQNQPLNPYYSWQGSSKERGGERLAASSSRHGPANLP
eukprot:4102941-Heterocapsa_arctica.AAC.1